MIDTPSLKPAVELAERNGVRFPNESDAYCRAGTDWDPKLDYGSGA